MAWLGIYFGISNTCGGMWSDGLRQNGETDEEHDEDCVKEGFPLVRIKLDRNGEWGRKNQGMWNCGINIWDRSELALAWSKKSSSYFENNFPM